MLSLNYSWTSQNLYDEPWSRCESPLGQVLSTDDTLLCLRFCLRVDLYYPSGSTVTVDEWGRVEDPTLSSVPKGPSLRPVRVLVITLLVGAHTPPVDRTTPVSTHPW